MSNMSRSTPTHRCTCMHQPHGKPARQQRQRKHARTGTPHRCACRRYTHMCQPHGKPARQQSRTHQHARVHTQTHTHTYTRAHTHTHTTAVCRRLRVFFRGALVWFSGELNGSLYAQSRLQCSCAYLRRRAKQLPIRRDVRHRVHHSRVVEFERL